MHHYWLSCVALYHNLVKDWVVWEFAILSLDDKIYHLDKDGSYENFVDFRRQNLKFTDVRFCITERIKYLNWP